MYDGGFVGFYFSVASVATFYNKLNFVLPTRLVRNFTDSQITPRKDREDNALRIAVRQSESSERGFSCSLKLSSASKTGGP